MTDDETPNGMVEGDIKPIPGMPWGVEFGVAEDQNGDIWVQIALQTPMGEIVLFSPPDFAKGASTLWHNTAVKAEARVIDHRPTLDVVKTDVSSVVEELRK